MLDETTGKPPAQARQIMLDLMEKAKAGEWLESSGGAQFWGGHYYLQTVQEITGYDWDDIWRATHYMMAQKELSLEGMVVQTYREPPAPRWDPCVSYEASGWRVTAALPAHSHMPQEWKFEVTNPAGEKVETDLPGEQLMFSPDFGPDVEDVEHAQARMVEILRQVRGTQAGSQ
jgi:hypothetical protein